MPCAEHPPKRASPNAGRCTCPPPPPLRECALTLSARVPSGPARSPALDTDANWEIGLICLVIGSCMLFLPLSAIYIVAKENFCPDGIKMPWDRKADATYVSNTEMGASDPGGASPNAV